MKIKYEKININVEHKKYEEIEIRKVNISIKRRIIIRIHIKHNI